MIERGSARFAIRYDRWCGWMLGGLGLGTRWSGVVVDDAGISVRMGWGFRARVDVADVRLVRRAGRPFVGWGVHGWRGRWLVNGSLGGVVEIEIDPPCRARVIGVPITLRTLFVSLADPEGFAAAVGRPQVR